MCLWKQVSHAWKLRNTVSQQLLSPLADFSIHRNLLYKLQEKPNFLDDIGRFALWRTVESTWSTKNKVKLKYFHFILSQIGVHLPSESWAASGTTCCSISCQISYTNLIDDFKKNPQFFKTIPPTKPKAEPQGAELCCSSSAQSSKDLQTSKTSSERRTNSPSAESSHQGSRSELQSAVHNGKLLQISVTATIQTTLKMLRVAQVKF